jgi:hypothetical protein
MAAVTLLLAAARPMLLPQTYILPSLSNVF